MATVRPEGKRNIGFNAPLDLIAALDKISMKRWKRIDRTKLLQEAVEKLIEREETGFTDDEAKEVIRQALKKEEMVAEVYEMISAYEAKLDKKQSGK